jgi:xanthosine utilization system XapX-like protein
MTQHANQNNSKILAAAALAVFIVMALLGVHFRALPARILIGIDGCVVLAAVAINIKNTFETNEPWKTYLAMGAIIFTILVFGIPISDLYA